MSFDKYIYEKAENEVKQNRFRAEREAEERALDAERKIPEIKEISNELSRTSIELSKLILKNKGDFKENFEKITSVKGIQRISWADIADPPAVTSGSSDEAIGLATGVAKINDRIIIIMDFEKIVSTLNRDAGLDINGLEKIDRPTAMTGNKHIVVADDSKFLNKMITDSLSKVGFHNIMSFSNGQDAWEYVQSFKDKGDDITSHIACIISDIEMPKMDGHRLTKLIKDDKTLSQIPVLLFSSLINEQMIAKGKSVGADGQFSKPQIKELISYLIKVLS